MRSEAAKHRQALAQVLTWLSIALIWCVTAVQVLERLGVPIASLAAPAAVLGAALGFGAQQVVRDLIAGTSIVLERQYGYGDVVHIPAVGFTEGATGTIEEVALRTTRLRTPNGEVVIVPNGQIVQVTNLSRDWARAVVDVPLPVEVDVMRASELLRKVGEGAFDDEPLRPLLLDPPTVMGVESFEVGQVNLRMVPGPCPASSSRWVASYGSAWPWPSSARASVLALLAMEAPSTLGARDFHDGRALVLRATRVWDDDPATWSRRARYTGGQIDGRRLPSYVDEDGVDPDRKTETFAEVVLAVKPASAVAGGELR